MTTYSHCKQKKIAILLLSNTTYLGGAERRFARLFDFFLNQGLDITIYCNSMVYEAIISTIRREKVRLVNHYDGLMNLPYFMRKISLIILFGRIFYELRVQQFDQVHLSINPSMLTVFYTIFSKWLPSYSFSIVDSRLQSSSCRDKLCLIISSKNALAIDCLSEAIKNSAGEILMKYPLIQSYKTSESLLQLAPCSFLAKKRSIISESSVNSHRDIDILFLSRFVPGKGLEILEEAIKIVITNWKQNIEVHICGKGHLRFNIPDARVYWAEDSMSVMLRSKVFVSIQLVNNYPSQSLMEAMECGCAIIATDVGETRQLLDDSCALLISPNSTSLANAIMDLLEDPIRRNTIAKAAQRRVKENQSIEKFSEYFSKKILKLSDTEII